MSRYFSCAESCGAHAGDPTTAGVRARNMSYRSLQMLLQAKAKGAIKSVVCIAFLQHPPRLGAPRRRLLR